MRVPVNRIRGKAAAETPEDLLANELSKHHTVLRDKILDADNSFIAGIALPDHKLIIEVQEKQDNKAILKEMAREKLARAIGWSIFRPNEKEIQGDMDSVLYKIDREIQRKRFS
jgi:very-short-patch-repair endonuclease